MMADKDTAVIVERVGNGYQVRPMHGGSDMVCVRDILVFQDKGYVSAARDGQRTDATLLGWLDTHFTEAET
jgi:hypothetical protein